MLTISQLEKLVPAAFSDTPAPHVSENYSFVPTRDVIARMMENGWEAVKATQQKTRAGSRSSVLTAKHMIVFRPSGNDTPAKADLGMLQPTVSIINSHDWSSRMIAQSGILRLVCTNGLMAGQDIFRYSIRHDTVMRDIQQLSDEFSEKANSMLETVERWRGVELSHEATDAFLMEAAKLRYGDEATSDHAHSLSIVRRLADQGSNVWNLFNRVQENGMKGGYRVGRMTRASRGLSNIGATFKFNTDLWNLAEKFATN